MKTRQELLPNCIHLHITVLQNIATIILYWRIIMTAPIGFQLFFHLVLQRIPGADRRNEHNVDEVSVRLSAGGEHHRPVHL